MADPYLDIVNRIVASKREAKMSSLQRTASHRAAGMSLADVASFNSRRLLEKELGKRGDDDDGGAARDNRIAMAQQRVDQKREMLGLKPGDDGFGPDWLPDPLAKTLEVIDLPRAALVETVRQVGDAAGNAVFGHDDPVGWEVWKENVGNHQGVGQIVEDQGDSALQAVTGDPDAELPLNVKRAVGFVGDVGLDPLNFLAPEAALTKLGGSKGVARAMFQAGDEAVAPLAQKIATRGIKSLDDAEFAAMNDFLGAAGKPTLRGGVHFNVPGTRGLGSIVQGVRAEGASALKPHLWQNAGDGLRQVRIGMPGASRGASGSIGRGVSAVTGGMRDSRVGRVLMGDANHKGLIAGRNAKHWSQMRYGSAEESRNLFVTRDGERLGRGRAARFEHEMMHKADALLKEMNKAGVKMDDAMRALEDATYVPANSATIGFRDRMRQLDEEIFERANEAAGYEFIKWRDNHAPSIWTDEAVEHLAGTSKVQPNAPSPTDLDRAGFEKRAKYIVGEEIDGVQLVPAVEHPKGLTPREQANELLAARAKAEGRQPLQLFDMAYDRAIHDQIRFVAQRVKGEAALSHLRKYGVVDEATTMGVTPQWSKWDSRRGKVQAKLERKFQRYMTARVASTRAEDELRIAEAAARKSENDVEMAARMVDIRRAELDGVLRQVDESPEALAAMDRSLASDALADRAFAQRAELIRRYEDSEEGFLEALATQERATRAEARLHAQISSYELRLDEVNRKIFRDEAYGPGEVERRLDAAADAQRRIPEAPTADGVSEARKRLLAEKAELEKRLGEHYGGLAHALTSSITPRMDQIPDVAAFVDNLRTVKLPAAQAKLTQLDTLALGGSEAAQLYDPSLASGVRGAMQDQPQFGSRRPPQKITDYVVGEEGGIAKVGTVESKAARGLNNNVFDFVARKRREQIVEIGRIEAQITATTNWLNQARHISDMLPESAALTAVREQLGWLDDEARELAAHSGQLDELGDTIQRTIDDLVAAGADPVTVERAVNLRATLPELDEADALTHPASLMRLNDNPALGGADEAVRAGSGDPSTWYVGALTRPLPDTARVPKGGHVDDMLGIRLVSAADAVDSSATSVGTVKVYPRSTRSYGFDLGDVSGASEMHADIVRAAVESGAVKPKQLGRTAEEIQAWGVALERYKANLVGGPTSPRDRVGAWMDAVAETVAPVYGRAPSRVGAAKLLDDVVSPSGTFAHVDNAAMSKAFKAELAADEVDAVLLPRQVGADPLDRDGYQRLLDDLADGAEIPQWGSSLKRGEETWVMKAPVDGAPPRLEPQVKSRHGFKEALPGEQPPTHLWRAMSEEEWAEAQARGYILSDQRGTIAEWEGTNFAARPDDAVSYLPRDGGFNAEASGRGVIVRVAYDDADGYFMSKADSYVRTQQPVPLDRVDKVVTGLYKNEKTHLFQTPPPAAADWEVIATNPERAIGTGSVGTPAPSTAAQRRYTRLFGERVKVPARDGDVVWTVQNWRNHLSERISRDIAEKTRLEREEIFGVLPDYKDAADLARTLREENLSSLKRSLDERAVAKGDLDANIEGVTAARADAEREFMLAEALRFHRSTSGRHAQIADAEGNLQRVLDAAIDLDDIAQDALAEVATLRGAAAKAEADLLKRYKSFVSAEDASRAIRGAEPEKLHLMQRTLENGWSQINWHTVGPDYVEAALKGMWKVQSDPDWLRTVIRPFDYLTNLFKSYATMTPGFVWRNTFGGVFNNWLAGVDESTYPLFMKARAAEHKVLEKIRAGESTEAARWAAVNRAVGPKAGGLYREMVEGGILGEVGQSAEFADILSRRSKTTFGRVADRGINNFATRAVQRWNSRAEANLRGVLALDGMMKGKGLEQAWDDVFTYHFDYSDLADAERLVGRRVIPFYTWTRKNLPLQVESLIRTPGKFNRYNAVKRNIELGSQEEDLVPSWFNAAMGMRLGNVTRGGDQVYLMPDLPMKDLQMLSGNPDRLWGQMNPLIKAPIERQSGVQLWNGVPFRDGYQLAPSWANTPGLSGALEGLGIARRDADGDLMMRDKDIVPMEAILPLLGRMRRAVPNEEKYQDRWWTSMASMLFGVAVRSNTEQDQIGELRRQERKLDALAQDYRSLGKPSYAEGTYSFETDGRVG